MNRIPFFLLFLLLFLLVGCGMTEEPSRVATVLPTAVVSALSLPTPTASPLSTATSSPPPTPTTIPTSEPLPDTPEPVTVTPTEPPPTLFTYGRTAEGAFFRGNPEADVVLIDYSDFL